MKFLRYKVEEEKSLRLELIQGDDCVHIVIVGSDGSTLLNGYVCTISEKKGLFRCSNALALPAHLRDVCGRIILHEST